ncbi:MAG: metallo-beta-lactamase family protein [Desulfotomaculum sp. BICA1-6]|nr:MAG: metallo-beta-lactamase family protein [Peptococcaceae bacterium BRH_c8a]KJS77221.1 MAG: metallo-beta-lactamase family protein [Desulfotomaculum sp. BICA1-6]
MTTQQVTPDIFLLQFPLVNAFMVGDPNNQNKEWVLIGAGMAHTSKDIFQAAEGRFGQGSQPKAIILTHGHFDHVGAITELTNTWNVPVYAHAYELPYLTGQMDYPPADPSVDKGLIARISPTFPHKGINLGTRAAPLPADGSVPWMPGWQWIHTPGHSPGHVSLFRDSDRVLIVGDAFTTLKQESATSVLTREKEVHGPPAYFTTDWQAAEQSVQVLNELNPSLVIPSHGLPMGGEELKQQLSELAHNFVHLAVPEQGQYVGQPAPNS